MEAGVEGDLDVTDLLRLLPFELEPGAVVAELRAPAIVPLPPRSRTRPLITLPGRARSCESEARGLRRAGEIGRVLVAQALDGLVVAQERLLQFAQPRLVLAKLARQQAVPGAKRRRRAGRLAHDGAGGHHARGGEAPRGWR